jgi:DNA-binding winged helix-turn-helix (wHTH) protein
MDYRCFRFEGFLLDARDRQLRRDGVPVELNARYLDALALLVREAGRLVTKDRFHDEVWRGVPVTDEALTQCIKTLRRQLGDSATAPRFIETVPKHGYRFIAAVEVVAEAPAALVPPPAAAVPPPGAAPGGFVRQAAAGTAGAGLAGAIGGVFYGFLGASQPLAPGAGALSVLLVLLCVTLGIALVGGAGVSIGIAAADRAAHGRWWWSVAGGAGGGLAIGAVVKLLGTDALNLLFGRAPGGITGAAEGLALGAAVGLASWAGRRIRVRRSLRHAAAAAGAIGAVAGAAVAAAGGRLFGGSLDLLARQFPESRLRLDAVGALLGEPGFGPVSRLATSALEGALFAACIVAVMLWVGPAERGQGPGAG